MTCTQCGRSVRDGDRFCGGCGAPVEVSEVPAEPAVRKAVSSSIRPDLDAHELQARRNLIGPREGDIGLENTASRAVDAFLLAAVDGRGDDVGELLTSDFALADTREGLTFDLDRKGMIANSQVTLGLGFVVGSSRRDVLAVRGDSIVLICLRYVASNGFEVETLYVVEADEASSLSGGVAFNASDLVAAVAELDRRYAASLEPDEQATLDAFTASLDAGVVLVAVPRIGPGRIVARCLGDRADRYLAVSQADPEGTFTVERFGWDDDAQALARFDALS